MTCDVVVLGAGVAGTSAALAAAGAGARVTLVDGGPGASSLWTGAVDGHDGPGPAPGVAAALGVRLEASGLATTLGFLRPAVGHDAALLDLAPFEAARDSVVAVACRRPGWDARAVARAASLRCLEVPVTRHTDEHALPDADFAARHDDGERLAWLAGRLREALARSAPGARAVLLPPSLGVERARATELSRLVGLPCGEAIGMPGGPAGLRFERARDRALDDAGVRRVSDRAVRVEGTGATWRVALEGAELEATAVVLATGGLVGGGIAYDPAEARAPFRLTCEAPAVVGARGRPLGVPGSLFSVPPESLGWPLARDPLMARVGVLCDEGDGRVTGGLFAAGEVAADAPRTWLGALRAGARAGTAAAGA